MALNKTQIVSNAITIMGHDPILSLEGGDNLVVAAEQAFDLLLPAVLASNNWRFAIQISQLSQSIVVPPYPWKTIYLLPAGWLKTIQTYPNIYVWDIYADNLIYTQFQGVFSMEYVFEPGLNNLPPHFTNYFVWEIAAYLSLSSAQKPEMYAPIEAKRKEAFAMAAAIEAQNRPNFSQVDFPVLNNRYVGSFVGNTF